MGVVEKTMVIEEMDERINGQQNNFRQPSWKLSPEGPLTSFGRCSVLLCLAHYLLPRLRGTDSHIWGFSQELRLFLQGRSIPYLQQVQAISGEFHWL